MKCPWCNEHISSDLSAIDTPLFCSRLQSGFTVGRKINFTERVQVWLRMIFMEMEYMGWDASMDKQWPSPLQPLADQSQRSYKYPIEGYHPYKPL